MHTTKKTLAFISTHIINQAVISEYKKLSKVENCDCILAIDNSNLKMRTDNPVTEKEFYGTRVNCFFFDKTIHDELNLPWFFENRETNKFAEIMWYNCDYRFYYARKYFPEYEYYWQFEYDIYCNGDSYQPFFDKYSGQKEDLLTLKFKEETSSQITFTRGSSFFCTLDNFSTLVFSALQTFPFLWGLPFKTRIVLAIQPPVAILFNTVIFTVIL